MLESNGGVRGGERFKKEIRVSIKEMRGSDVWCTNRGEEGGDIPKADRSMRSTVMGSEMEEEAQTTIRRSGLGLKARERKGWWIDIGKR